MVIGTICEIMRSEETGQNNGLDTEVGQYGTHAAVSETEFENLQNCPLVTITDYAGMGTMSEFDYFVSFTIHCGTFGGES